MPDLVTTSETPLRNNPGQLLPGTVSYKMFLFFFKIFIYLSMTETHTHIKRERERERQRHKQVPHREPDVGLDPRSPGS